MQGPVQCHALHSEPPNGQRRREHKVREEDEISFVCSFNYWNKVDNTFACPINSKELKQFNCISMSNSSVRAVQSRSNFRTGSTI